VEQLVNKKKISPIQMQWEDNLDTHSKIVKSMELSTIEDSLISSKGEVGETKSEEVISRVTNQEVPIEEAAVNQGNETEKIPVDPSPNYMVLSERDQHQEVRMSTRVRRPPVKLTKDFL
jgi:hypothetical protein